MADFPRTGAAAAAAAVFATVFVRKETPDEVRQVLLPAGPEPLWVPKLLVTLGLAALTGFASEAAFLDELLYNRKWSLLFEGHRWIDMRRFGRLDALPKDLANHIVAAQLPVPQTECLARANADAPLKAPGCI